MSTLQDRLNRDPEVVKLEPGESIVGTVLDITTRQNEYGSYPLVSLETDDGRELEWHALHTVAANELAKVNPQPGDVLGVRNLGKRDGKNYVSYRIVVERNTPAPSMTVASAAVLEATAARDAATARNALLIPIMEEHGFATAGEAIDYLEANPPAAQALDVSKLKQYEDEEPW